MSALPSALAEIVDDFAAVGASDKLTLLLEFSRELPPLPAELEQSAMEPVPECQSPLFLSVDDSDRDNVRLYFSAPPRLPRRVVSHRSSRRGSTATAPTRSSVYPTTSIRRSVSQKP